MADTQAEPGTIACFLGGEERVKYPPQIFRGDTRTIISK